MSLNEILHSGPVALIVLAILLAFSISSWAIIIFKSISLNRAQKASVEFIDLFWKLRRFEDVFEMSKRYENSPLTQVFLKGYHEIKRLKKSENLTDTAVQIEASGIESVEHTLRKASLKQMAQLENTIPFLATVGSASPFIGLFGTVIGIMGTFAAIGQQGSANLATVAPGMAEALVATAAGLLAAIPAVIAYNYFSVRIRTLSIELETFSSDFVNIAKRHFKP